jgi:hypothetical protein
MSGRYRSDGKGSVFPGGVACYLHVDSTFGAAFEVFREERSSSRDSHPTLFVWGGIGCCTKAEKFTVLGEGRLAVDLPIAKIRRTLRKMVTVRRAGRQGDADIVV